MICKPIVYIGRFLASPPKDGGHAVERVVVRLGIPILLAISLYLAIRIAGDMSTIPKVAFENQFPLSGRLQMASCQLS